ncbi:ABC transporter ATP-binding protein [Escherichia coli]|nr:ABC transporter ATP-binding protein [Escherichia coli]
MAVTTATGWAVTLKPGCDFTDGNWNLTPYASLTGFTADNPEYHLSNGMKSKSVDTRSIYRELGATLSYNMRLGTVWKLSRG